MKPIIEVEDLVKVYPDGTRAVDGVTFDVSEGEIFGFLGPNGAGKTTTIRVLVTLLPKTSGAARVVGVDVAENPEHVRRTIGYAAQFIGVDIDLTARENLILQGRLHAMSFGDAARRADELLDLMALSTVAHKRAGTFSGGMRRRLDLAQALVHSPPIVFLDEPTTGLDPQTRKALWQHLEEMNRAGTTIFLTTQYLEEADRLCRRLAIIDHGKIVVTGAPAVLKRDVGGDVITLTLPEDVAPDVFERAGAAMAGLPGASAPQRFDHSFALPVPRAPELLSDLIRRLDEQRVPIEALTLSSPSLDDVFLRYTGERMRIEATDSRAASSAMAFVGGGGRGR